MAQTLLQNQAMGATARLASKIITATRDLTAAGAPTDVAYTGVGFKPTAIICLAAIDGSGTVLSIGVADSSKTVQNVDYDAGTTYYINNDRFIAALPSGANYQTAIVKSYDDDGFTLTWTKSASPTGTLRMTFLCFR